MVRVSNSGTRTEKVESHSSAEPAVPARSQSRGHHHNRLADLPPIPPPPPPHDDVPRLQDFEKAEGKSRPLPVPPPPPPSKSFYNPSKFSRSRNMSPTFLETFMARHPRVSRHRRRFAAILFTTATLLILLIVLLAVLLSRKSNRGDGNNGGWYGSGSSGGIGGGGGGGGGGYGDTATEIELQKHNQGIPKPPINYSDAPGWTRNGQGDATFYDPSVKNSVGKFQEGACEFLYINSVHDMIAALNKPDFGQFPIASKSPACGQCLQVAGPNGTVQVQIVDMCPGCKSGSVDLSPGAFAKIADLDAGRVRIRWQRCP